MDSAMYKRTLREQLELCDSVHCNFCVMAAAEEITDVDHDFGPQTPDFDLQIEDTLVI
jgi:hypothetical protein